jgi:putative phosphoribosyl transferase
MGPFLYRDRRDAGRRLAALAERWRHDAPVVLAVPRGGVPVGLEVARALGAPLDILAVHHVGRPGNRVGAVAEGGLAVIDHDRVRELGLTADELSELRRRAREAADADARRLRRGAAPLDVVGRTVVIVDDGAWTGASTIAAAHTARRRGAARVVLALPAAPAAVLGRLGEAVDEVVCVEVGPSAASYAGSAPVTDASIASALDAALPMLDGQLHVPEAARGVVVSISGTPRVREALDAMGFATLQMAGGDVEDIAAAVARLHHLPATEHLALGIFGLGVDAEKALAAADDCGASAVVAAGGRPVRATALPSAPTLLIAGGEDTAGRRLVEALGTGEHHVAVVAGATRAFTEPGALDQVAHLAGSWFARHLVAETT